MTGFFATRKTRAEMHHAKSFKTPSILRNFARLFRHSFHSGISQNTNTVVCSVAATAVSSSLASDEEESSSTSSGSCVSKQISFESASSFATTESSTVSSASPSSLSPQVRLSETSAIMPEPPKPILSLLSSSEIPVSADEVFQGDIITTMAAAATSVCSGPPFNSGYNLFSSASSSSMLDASQSADEVNDQPIVTRDIAAIRSVELVVPTASYLQLECEVYEASDVSSIEVSYQSVRSGSPTGDSSSYKSTFDVDSDELSSADSISRIDQESQATLSFHGSDDATAAETNPPSSSSLWENARGMSWTDCFNSDSSSFSLCDLLRTNDTSPDSDAIPNINDQPPVSPPSRVTEDGKVADMSPHSANSLWNDAQGLSWTNCFSSDSSSSSLCDLGSDENTSPDPVMIQAEVPLTASLAALGSGAAMPLYVIAEEEEPEESYHEEGEPKETYYEESDFTESMCDYNNYEEQSALTYRNAFVAHVINNATPPSLRRRIATGIVWDDLRSFPTINEEDEESAGSVVAESISYDSSLTESSEQFEYAEYSLTTESRANSGLSDVDDSRFPVRAMSRCCMREDFRQLDDE